MERRKKRDAQLEEKHRLEMEEELTRQQQERDKLKEGIARKVEDQELKKNVKVGLCLLLVGLEGNQINLIDEKQTEISNIQ